MKIRLLLIATIGVLIFSSCEKENTLLEVEQNDEVLYYTNENTTPVPWGELPELIRNAEVLNNKKRTLEDAKSNSRTACPTFLGLTEERGGNGDNNFIMFPTSSCDRIYGLVIKAGDFVDAFFIVYQRENGTTYIPEFAGGNGGEWFGYLFADDEYISHYSVRTSNVVNHIGIETNSYSNPNQHIYHGGFGGSHRYYYAGSGKQFMGFYGESGSFLNKIGGMIYTNDL